jgi:hypothetical protein
MILKQLFFEYFYVTVHKTERRKKVNCYSTQIELQ